ncbi:MAG TPA: hypothetical protein VFY71_11450 [Planctomycetota bacterium]|nr:hypothetical protein [Planctomycetota bacterium]
MTNPQTGAEPKPLAQGTKQVTEGMTGASSLMGKSIVDARGQALAQIHDVIVDSQGGLTAVVELPGTPGFTGIPLSKLSPMVVQTPAGAAPTGTQPTAAPVNDATVAVDHFVFSGNIAQLQKAPVLNDVSTVDDQWLTQVDQTFGVPANHVTSTAGEPVRRPIGLQELLRRRVASVGGEGLGNVKDVGVSLRDSRAAFLVFGGQVAGQADPVFHGVALDSFHFEDPQNVLIDTDRAALARSKGVDLARMPSKPSFALPPGPKVIRTPGNGTAPADKPGGAGASKPDSGPK